MAELRRPRGARNAPAAAEQLPLLLPTTVTTRASRDASGAHARKPTNGTKSARSNAAVATRGTSAPRPAKAGAVPAAGRAKPKVEAPKPAARRPKAQKPRATPARGAKRKVAKPSSARRSADPGRRKPNRDGATRNGSRGSQGRTKPVANGRRGGSGKGQVAATQLMRIRELDPMAACGPGTSVMQLFRVDDLPTDWASTHLVFFDRHGWYCEHGRECAAVAAVRKLKK